MGIGSTIDCGAGQAVGDGTVTEIWVPAGPTGQSVFYDVTSTFTFGPTIIDFPPDIGATGPTGPTGP